MDKVIKLLPCPKCQRAPKVETYAINPQHGYLSCDCGITFNGHHGDSLTKLAERWNTRRSMPRRIKDQSHG